MTPLTLFGFLAVTAMMLFYWLEERWLGYTFLFAVASAASSLYGWLAGTWPFGLVEAVWTVVALRRWQGRRRGGPERDSLLDEESS